MTDEIWNQKKLEQLISMQAEESINLDFKDGRALGISDNQKFAICKHVSAFANSDGGTIIYGLSEINHKASSLSPIDGTVLTKEWLENVITSGIQQKIEDLIIEPVRLDGCIEKTVYVVKVPVSHRAPHMVKGAFYKRYNFKSVPMEEYEVRHTYGRKQKVILENKQVHMAISNLKTWQTDNFFLFTVDYHLKNIGNSVAESYRLRCELPNFVELDYKFPTGKDYSFIVNKPNVFVSQKNSILLFPEEDINALHFTFKVAENNIDIIKGLQLKTILYTDHGNSNFTHNIGKVGLGLIERAKLLTNIDDSNINKVS